MSRSFRVYTPRAQGKRPTLLYVRWRDMRSRTFGRATKNPELYDGLELGWQTFEEFRAWALANGFDKANNSPDRQDVALGYVPGNVRFVPPYENTVRALTDYHAWCREQRQAGATATADDVPF